MDLNDANDANNFFQRNTISGRWEEKSQSADELGQLTPDMNWKQVIVGRSMTPATRRGTVVQSDGFTLRIQYPDGTQSVEVAADVQRVDESTSALEELQADSEAIEAIADKLPDVSLARLEDVSWTHLKINEGSGAAIRTGAYSALFTARKDGFTNTELDAQLDGEFACPSIIEVEGAVGYRARTAAQDAMLALSARHLVGQMPGWTQEAYDHLTRPWSNDITLAHPDDEVEPESWELLPVPSASLKRTFDNDLQKLNEVIEKKGALIIVEGPGEAPWRGVDEAKLGPKLTEMYQRLQQFGYAQGLIGDVL